MSCLSREELEAKRRIEDFAANQSYGVPFCPRCGRESIKEPLYTNAWSRYADVYICSACGTDEALRDMTGTPMLLTEWAIMRNALGIAPYAEEGNRETDT